MTCPACGSKDYYFGLMGHNCATPSCRWFGASQALTNPQSHNNESWIARNATEVWFSYVASSRAKLEDLRISRGDSCNYYRAFIYPEKTLAEKANGRYPVVKAFYIGRDKINFGDWSVVFNSSMVKSFSNGELLAVEGNYRQVAFVDLDSLP